MLLAAHRICCIPAVGLHTYVICGVLLAWVWHCLERPAACPIARGRSSTAASPWTSLLCAAPARPPPTACAPPRPGRNVAPYVEMEWGGKAYELMWELKALFDSTNVLNPGVILNK